MSFGFAQLALGQTRVPAWLAVPASTLTAALGARIQRLGVARAAVARHNIFALATVPRALPVANANLSRALGEFFFAIAALCERRDAHAAPAMLFCAFAQFALAAHSLAWHAAILRASHGTSRFLVIVNFNGLIATILKNTIFERIAGRKALVLAALFPVTTMIVLGALGRIGQHLCVE